MAVQEIGVKAIFDTTQFNTGLQEYIDGMTRATAAARAFAGDANIPIPAPRIDDGDLGGRVRRTSGLLDNLKKLLSGDISGATGIASSAFSGLATVIGGALVAGIGAAVAGIAGLGVALKASVSTAADFEQQVANIAAVSGKGIEGVSELRDLALDLSIDPNLTVSAGGAAEAIEMLLKNGIEAEDVLNGLGRSTIALSNATGSDFATAADVATDAMNIFGVTAENFGEVADSITGVMVNSKFGINDVALAMAQGGAVAKSFGVDFDQFATIIAGVSSNFASGSDAGTSFKTFLQRLIAPTNAAAEAMQDLGISAVDDEGNFRDIYDIMRQFSKLQGQVTDGTLDLTQAQLQERLVTIFGADAIRFATTAMSLQEEQLDSLSQRVNQSGQAQQAAATRTQTFQGAMERLSSQFEYLKILVGTPFLESLSDFVDNVVIPKLNLLQKAFDGLTLDNFTSKMLNLGKDLATALAFDIGGEDFGKKVETALNGAMASFARFQNFSRQEGYLTGIAVWAGFDAGQAESAMTAIANIQATLSGLSESFSTGGFAAVSFDISQLFNFGETGTQLDAWLGQLDAIFGSVAGMIGERIDNFFATISSGQDFTTILGNLGFDQLAESLSNLYTKITGLDSGLDLNAFMTGLGASLKVFASINLAAGVVAIDALVATLDALGSVAVDSLIVVVDMVQSLGEVIKGLATIAVDDTQFISAIGDLGGQIAEAIFAPFAGEEMTAMFTGLGTIMGEGIANAISYSIQSTMPSTETAQQIGFSMMSWMGWGIEESPDAKSATVSATGEAIDEGVVASEGATSIGRGITDGATQGIEGGKSSVINASVSMAREAIDAANAELGIQSPSKVFAGIGGFMAQGMVEGMSSGMASIGRASVAMAQYATAQATPNYSVNNSRTVIYNMNYTSQQSSKGVRQDVLLLRAMHA